MSFTKKLRNAWKRVPHIHIPAFRIFYNSTFSFLLLVLFAALAITPGDHIYETIANNKIGNVFVIAGAYLVTAVIALFIYASRLYTNRTTLAAIPRSYLPIAKGELSKKVYRAIVHERERSALVAWEGRPRNLWPEATSVNILLHQTSQDDPNPDVIDNTNTQTPPTRTVTSTSKKTTTTENDKQHHHHLLPHRHTHSQLPPNTIPMQTLPPISATSPPWGSIAHPGWSAPGSEDIPSLHFQSVISEFPHLLEAQAVALAPPDPAFDFLTNAGQIPSPFAGDNSLAAQIPPDPAVVAAVQRRKEWGLREYIAHLIDAGVLDLYSNPGLNEGDDEEEGEEAIEAFIRRYEFARYSVQPLTEQEFRDLMTRFARVLNMIRGVERMSIYSSSSSSLSAASSLRRNINGRRRSGASTPTPASRAMPPVRSADREQDSSASLSLHRKRSTQSIPASASDSGSIIVHRPHHQPVRNEQSARHGHSQSPARSVASARSDAVSESGSVLVHRPSAARSSPPPYTLSYSQPRDVDTAEPANEERNSLISGSSIYSSSSIRGGSQGSGDSISRETLENDGGSDAGSVVHHSVSHTHRGSN